jgi:antitoxin Phd
VNGRFSFRKLCGAKIWPGGVLIRRPRSRHDKCDRWQLKDAKKHLSEVVRRAGEDGPQIIAVGARDAVVVLAFDEYQRLQNQRAISLVEFFRTSPLVGAKLEISRSNDAGRASDQWPVCWTTTHDRALTRSFNVIYRDCVHRLLVVGLRLVPGIPLGLKILVSCRRCPTPHCGDRRAARHSWRAQA